MNVFSGIVLFLVIWFVALLTILPMRVRAREEAGLIVPGTPASAPVDLMIGRKLIWATVAGVLIWAPIAAIILCVGLSIREIDVWGRM